MCEDGKGFGNVLTIGVKRVPTLSYRVVRTVVSQEDVYSLKFG